MLPDRVSNPGPLTYESGALPISLRGPAKSNKLENLRNMIMSVLCSDKPNLPIYFHCYHFNYPKYHKCSATWTFPENTPFITCSLSNTPTLCRISC